jgi:aldehyde:ferredoxin oxidoreductase
MLDKIVFREGIGDILAEGIFSAAQEIGRGSEAYANQVKGLPMLPMQIPEDDAQSKPLSLATAVGPRGGDTLRTMTTTMENKASQSPQEWEEHKQILRAEAKRIRDIDSALDQGTYENKAEIVAYYEDLILMSDMLSTCKWLNRWDIGGWSPGLLAELYSAGSGVETSIDTLFDFAGKARTLERAFEAGEGLRRDLDTLPKRAFLNSSAGETLESNLLDPAKFEDMKSQYYEARGWGPATGIPTEDTLIELGLEDLAKDLVTRGVLPPSGGGGQ